VLIHDSFNQDEGFGKENLALSHAENIGDMVTIPGLPFQVSTLRNQGCDSATHLHRLSNEWEAQFCAPSKGLGKDGGFQVTSLAGAGVCLWSETLRRLVRLPKPSRITHCPSSLT